MRLPGILPNALPAWLREPGAVIDLETTGLDPLRARVVQIGIVLIDKGVFSSPWESLVRPPVPIESAASAVHGLIDKDVASAPTFAEIALEVMTRLEGRSIVAYNGLAYDVPVLQRELADVALLWTGQVIDPLITVREFDPTEPSSLEAAAKRWGVQMEGGHRALTDAITAACLLARLCYQRPAHFRRPFATFLRWQYGAAVDQQRARATVAPAQTPAPAGDQP